LRERRRRRVYVCAAHVDSPPQWRDMRPWDVDTRIASRPVRGQRRLHRRRRTAGTSSARGAAAGSRAVATTAAAAMMRSRTTTITAQRDFPSTVLPK